jgi:hypothetical protein
LFRQFFLELRKQLWRKTPKLLQRVRLTQTCRINIPLGVCTTGEQLDCIESFHLKSPSGEFVAATSDKEQTWTTERITKGTEFTRARKYTSHQQQMDQSPILE